MPVGLIRHVRSEEPRSTAVRMVMTGRTQLAGILGWPVAHSLSPRLHGYWLRRYGIDGAYLPLPVRPMDLAVAVEGLAASGFRGANVTVPHKQAALDLCNHVTPFAARTGAVNTLIFEDGQGILGSNTDGDGFLKSLATQGASAEDGPALVLGAGGAARAIAAALLDAGCPTTVTARQKQSADDLAVLLPGLMTLPWPGCRGLGQYGLLVNATAGGMIGCEPLAYDLSRADRRLTVADIVYAPRETVLLADARERGLRTVEGIDMLLFQAAIGFAAWFGVVPAVDADVRNFVVSA